MHQTPLEELNTEISNLWDATFHDNDVLAPLFFNNLTRGQLLFVGINPSFSDIGFKLFLKNSPYELVDYNALFKWRNARNNSDIISHISAIDHYALDHHTYFPKLRKIAEHVGKPWNHVDIFFYRQTKQSEFEKLVLKKGRLTNFGEAQLHIFMKYLHLTAPKCIVVVNAKASEIIRTSYADEIIWNDEKGHHYINIEGDDIPIFFSSMLSGQRALDRWSYERLMWHISYALK